MKYFLVFLCAGQFVIIAFLCIYIVKFAKKIFSVEESIESSLDIMDESYRKVFEKETALARRFTKVSVDDPSVKDAK